MEVINEFKMHGYPIPGRIIDITNAANTICPRYDGVYRVEFEQGYITYFKRSDLLDKPFLFDDIQMCTDHINVYKELIENEGKSFYHPDTKIISSVTPEGKYMIMVSMPRMITRCCRGEKLIPFPFDKFEDKKSRLFSLGEEDFFHRDVNHEFNYGLAEDGELYFIDINLFHEVPSPLVTNIKHADPT